DVYKRQKQYNLMSLIKRTEILTHVFVSLQALLAFTVIINLNLYFVRTFQTFPCNLSEDRLLTHWAPQAYPHARQLRQQLKDDATVAVHAEGGTFNLYLFSAFAYPVRCFYAAALDKASSEPHKQKQPHSAVQLDYYLHYDPFCTTSPFSLRRLAFP
ncbi:MAG: hypothetical protein N2Z21_03220, partial [Candidatus Sumerlaeaceae bacterium]|nr:hypothetical protein [Candidatus Sumerlaeaceae bacterium]